MSTFVLIHGAWHGAWCWDKVARLLTQHGHKVHAFDLPGHGHDTTPVAQVTLEAYAERVLDVIDQCSEQVRSSSRFANLDHFLTWHIRTKTSPRTATAAG